MGWEIKQVSKETKFSMTKENYEEAFPILKEILLKEFKLLWKHEIPHLERSKDLGDMFRNFGWDMRMSKVKPNLSNIEEALKNIQDNLTHLKSRVPVLSKREIEDCFVFPSNQVNIALEELKGDEVNYVKSIVNTTDDYGFFDLVFGHLAPFVTEGSYITIQSMEDTCELTRETFTNGKLVSMSKKEVWG